MKWRRDESKNKSVHLDPSSRRMFLKSAGGLTLSIPMMSSLLSTISEKAMADTVAPLRYVGVMTPHGGLQHKNWFGSNFQNTPFALASGRSVRVNSLLDMVGTNGLSPVFDSSFNNLWSKINIIAGLDQPVYFGHNRVVGNGSFSNSHDGYRIPSDQLTLNSLIGECPSIDQVIGYAGGQGIYGTSVGGRKRFVNLSTDSYTSNSWGRDDYFSPSNLVLARDVLNSPAGLFSYLFGSVSSASVTTGTVTSNPLINLVNQFWPSGKSLFSSLSSADRSTLDQFFQMAQDAAKQYSITAPVCDSSQKPSGTSATLATDGTSLQALADIITMAFKCDITRVVTLYIDGNVHPLGNQWHEFAHAPTSATPDVDQSGMVDIHSFIAKNFFARLGNNLLVADPSTGSSSILDNSLIYWTHENKVAHDNFCNPAFLMGGAGGRIRTGQFADIRDLSRFINVTAANSMDCVGDVHYPGEIINRLWPSIFYALNIPRSQYEIARGGNSTSQAITSGYGHVLNRQATWSAFPSYDLTRIGEPLEFLTKSTTVWS